jgi:orotidine-5'-phosphate decarboxylase
MFDVDAITINPYLGSDGIKPFVDDSRRYGKGCFILVKTSNPSSSEVQDQRLNGNRRLYEHIADLVSEWSMDLKGERGYSDIGAVVGATFPDDARQLRERLKDNFFLCPGYGSQGAQGRDVLHCFNRDGYGAIISSSRKINFAYTEYEEYSEHDFDQASLDAAMEMKEDIVDSLAVIGKSPW